jgi:hypothetical protein
VALRVVFVYKTSMVALANARAIYENIESIFFVFLYIFILEDYIQYNFIVTLNINLNNLSCLRKTTL